MKKGIVVGAALLAAGVAQASIVVTLDFTNGGNGGTASVGGSDVTFSTAANGTDLGMGTVQNSTETLGTVTLSDGGYTGLYNITVDVESTGATVADIGRGNSGTLGAGGALMISGTEFTLDNVVLSFVSGDDKFQFDGFNGVFIGNLSGTETATINELTIADGDVGHGSGKDFGPTASINLASSVVFTGTGTSLNVVDAQFTAIPEPATLGLIAAFGGGILFIRRRFMI